MARESADIVLLRPISTCARGVEDGRRTFANTLKYIGITTSANFGNMVSMALGTLFLPFLPLAAKQIPLNNFLSDLPLDRHLHRPCRPRAPAAAALAVKDLQRFMIVFGADLDGIDLLTFLLLHCWFHADEATFQTAWFSVSLLTELAVCWCCARAGVLAQRAQPACWGHHAGGGRVGAFVLPLLAPLQSLFGFVALAVVAGRAAVKRGAGLPSPPSCSRRIGAARKHTPLQRSSIVFGQPV